MLHEHSCITLSNSLITSKKIEPPVSVPFSKLAPPCFNSLSDKIEKSYSNKISNWSYIIVLTWLDTDFPYRKLWSDREPPLLRKGCKYASRLFSVPRSQRSNLGAPMYTVLPSFGHHKICIAFFTF